VQNSRCTVVTELVFVKLQDTERLLLWSRHFATRSPLAAEARNTFQRQLQTLRVFLTTVLFRVVIGSLVTLLQTCESVTFFLNCPVHTKELLENDGILGYHLFVMKNNESLLVMIAINGVGSYRLLEYGVHR
jgi:hypothetical protein